MRLYKAHYILRYRSPIVVDMSYTICIARYDEDVSWALPFATNVVVCNKGGKLASPLPQRRTPNFGREEYAYLKYIVDDYECLSDVSIFVQAGLKDHLDIYGDLRFSKEAPLVKHMLFQCKMFGHSMNAAPHRLGFCSAHPKFKLANRYPHMIDSKTTFGEWFESNVRAPFPTDPKWFKNGIFGVRREHILSRSKDYYQDLMKNFTSSDEYELCHYLERSWVYVFNVDRPLSEKSTGEGPSKLEAD